jgi:hypothetical protein
MIQKPAVFLVNLLLRHAPDFYLRRNRKRKPKGEGEKNG